MFGRHNRKCRFCDSDMLGSEDVKGEISPLIAHSERCDRPVKALWGKGGVNDVLGGKFDRFFLNVV